MIWIYIVLYGFLMFDMMFCIEDTINYDHNMISGKAKGCHHAARAMHGSSPHISTVAAASGFRAWPSDKTVVVASGKMLKLMSMAISGS